MGFDEVRKELKQLRQKSGKQINGKELLKIKYQNAIEALPPFESKILKLYFIDGKTYGEIAVEVFYSVDTVRRIIKRGIGMLRDNIK